MESIKADDSWIKSLVAVSCWLPKMMAKVNDTWWQENIYAEGG
jgi:hypothetical protein